MKDFRSVISDYLNKHDRHKKQLAAVVSLSMLVSFTVPMILQEPASSMTGDSFTPVSDILSTKLFNESVGNTVGNIAGRNGNTENGVDYSPQYISEVELLIGNGSPLAQGATDANGVIANAKSKYFLGIASDFCVFLENDFTPTAADAEGRVAVGGNVVYEKSDGNYQIGAGDYSDGTILKETDNYKDVSGFAQLIVGGQLIKQISPFSTKHKGEGDDFSLAKAEEDFYKRFVVGSNFNYNDSTHITNVKWNESEQTGYGDQVIYDNEDGHTHYYKTYTDTLPNGATDEKAQIYQTSSSSPLINFTDAFSYIKSQSDKLSKIKTIECSPSSNSIVFDAGEGCTDEIVYFSITGLGETETFPINVTFKNIPPNANIIVNCGNEKIKIDTDVDMKIEHTDGTTNNVSKRLCGKNNSPYSEKILFNFYNAGKNTLDSADEDIYMNANFNGTILAPYADVNAIKDNGNGNFDTSCHGHLSGSLIARSFKGGTEFGYRPYRGTVDILPSSSGYGVPIKKVIANTETGLAGATFEIFKGADGSEATGITFTSDADGNGYVNIPSDVQFDGSVYYTSANNVISNTYIIKETAAPEGFVLDDETSWKIDVTEMVGIADGDIKEINGTNIPMHVTTEVKIYDAKNQVTDIFNIDAKDEYTTEGKHESRYLTVAKNTEPTEYFIMKMDNSGSVNQVFKTDGNPPTTEATIVPAVSECTSVSSYNGTATTLDADGNPITDVKTEVVYPEVKEEDVSYLNQYSSLSWTHSDFTSNDYVDITKNINITYYYYTKENGHSSQTVNFSIDCYKKNITYEWGGTGTEIFPYSYQSGDFSSLNNAVSKENLIGISLNVDNCEYFSNESFSYDNTEYKVDNTKSVNTFTWGNVPSDEPVETTATTTSIKVVSSWYVTVPTTVYENIPATTYIDSVSYINVYSTETIAGLESKSGTYKSSTTFTTVVPTEDNQNPADNYQFDPTNKMIMPLPSEAPTFENDYGLIFKKLKVSGGETLGLLEGATIDIQKADGTPVESDILSGTKGSVTIDITGLKLDTTGETVYKFVEDKEKVPTGYESADPVYFKIIDKTVYYGSTEECKDGSVDLTKNNTDQKSSVDMKDTMISGAKIMLSKFEDDTDKTLTGATFQLWADKGDGVPVYPVKKTDDGFEIDGTFTIDSADFNLYDVLKNAANGTYNTEYVKDGYLKNDMYYLQEISAPDGYQKQDAPFKFKVNSDYTIEMRESGTPAYITIFEGNKTDQYTDKNSYENVSAIEVIATFSSGYDETISFDNDGPIKIQGNTNWISGGITGWSNLLTNTTLGSRTVTPLGNNQYSIKYEFNDTQSLNGSLDGNIQYQHNDKVPTLNEIRIYGEEGEGSGGSVVKPYTIGDIIYNAQPNFPNITKLTFYYSDKDAQYIENVELDKQSDWDYYFKLVNLPKDNVIGIRIETGNTGDDWKKLVIKDKDNNLIFGTTYNDDASTVKLSKNENKLLGVEKMSEPDEPDTPADDNTDEPLNIEVDGNLIKIPNRPLGNSTSISVEKKWADNVERFPELKPEAITVRLERYLEDGTTPDNPETAFETKTLNAENQWKASWTDLESKYTDDNGENVYKYKVVEVTTGLDNYKAPTYSPENTSSGKIEITNELEAINITAKKNWVDNNGGTVDTEFIPASVEVNLQYSVDNGKSWEYVTDGIYTLTKDEGWEKTILDLPDCYEYRIVEQNVPNGWEVQTYNDNASKTDTITSITNKQIVGSISITKNWKGDSESNRPQNIIVELYRSTQSPDSAESTIPVVSNYTENYDNYAKALQYSLYFYDANMCGSQVGETSAYSWRDDCHTYCSVDGGFHDAGDHVIFGLPQGFTASTLGWEYYEFHEAFDSLGLTDHYKTIMEYFCDFFVASTTIENGSVTNFLYQKGNSGTDHAYWGTPEAQTESQFGQKEYWTTNGASDIAADYAAALAAYAVNFPNDSKSDNYLKTAKALYEFSNKYNNCKMDGQVGFYQDERTDATDEQAWASAWLYLATNGTYISADTCKDKIIAAQKYQTNQTAVDPRGHFWNNVTLGAASVYSEHISKNDTETKQIVTDFINKNCTGNEYKILDWSTNGASRHNTLLQTVALAATKNFDDIDYTEWCANQMSFILGNNHVANNGKDSSCFVTAFADNSVKNTHHRAASGYENGNNGAQQYSENGHIIIGALSGGANNINNDNTDHMLNYDENEVALDYNAGLVGAAAGLYQLTGKGEKDTLEQLKAASKDSGFKPYTERVINVKVYTEEDTITVPRATGDDKNTGLLSIGDEKKLVLADTNAGETITWTSSNESVAEITENGILTAVEDGKATIQAKINDILVAEYDLTVRIASITPDVSEMGSAIETIESFTKNGNTWTATVSDLPIYDANGKEYYYYIKEIVPNGYYAISYADGVSLANDTKLNSVSVTNKKSDNEGVTMPSAGGTGTHNYYIVGACMIGIAGIFLIRRRKKVTE